MDRWCLWFDDDSALDDIARSSILSDRVAGVKQMREESKAASTRAKADIPYKFGQIQQPSTDYLAIPKTVSNAAQISSCGVFLPRGYRKRQGIHGA